LLINDYSGTAFCPEACQLLLKVLGVVAIYKKPKPVEVTSNEDASEQAIGIQANTDEVVKQSAPEQSSVATRSDVLIKNLLTYSELLAVVAKFPGAQVFDERDQANGYLWVRQAGGVDNANPKLVKWLGDHKFLLKAEKGWFLPIL
jgi:hypothetical protein